MTMVQQQRLTLSLTLNISSYIIENEGTVHYSLKRPVELAQVFKDNIAHKLLTDIRKGNLPLPASLLPSHSQCVLSHSTGSS